MEIKQRLEVFFARLRNAPACRNPNEALSLACRLIDEVENEYCKVARQEPPPMIATGRMYSPLADHIFKLPDGSIRAETRRHGMHFGIDGSISIRRTRSGAVEFFKPGANM